MMWRRYLFWFAHEHVDFRYAEMQSIVSLLKIDMRFIEQPSVRKPYWIVELPSEDCARGIASRSVLLKNCIELWSKAKTKEQLHKNLKNCLQNCTGKWIISEGGENANDRDVCPSILIEACSSVKKTFKIMVETFCKHYTMKEKVAKIESFSYLPLEGSVKLKNPDITLCYLEFFGDDPNNVPEEPYDLFFGKLVADGQRDLIHLYSLKKREFIGNTSMDAQLALIMANQAQVKSGDVVLDPFVGSGSLLVAAAHFGAYVWGSDIDFMMLHGRTRPSRVGKKVRTKDESIQNNMKQYSTASRYLDVLVSDFSLPLWREGFKFDAIITDPPYGVREPTEKIGIDKENYTLSDKHLSNHIPAKVEYDLLELYEDLLKFADAHLEVGRRLVCWFPLPRDEEWDGRLPRHPALRLVGAAEQPLSRRAARRLLTYEKCAPHAHPPPHPAHPAHPAHLAHPAHPAQHFRDKYFAGGEMSRREKKERAQEMLINSQNMADVT